MRGFFCLIILCFLLAPISAQEFKAEGATFPTLLFQKMFEQYKKESGRTISYASTGSGSGLLALSSGKVDFAVSDIQECCESRFSDEFVQIPVTIGAVAIIYHLPGDIVLKLSPSVISDIFQGKITYWNNPRIQEENQGTVLPDLPIKVFLRGDRSGTTSLLTSYLTRASNSWAEDVGVSSTLLLKSASYVSGNITMVTGVKDVVGAIGYAEWHYAMAYDVSIAAVRNFSGIYVQPSITAIETSLKTVDDPKESDVYTYPITGYSYLVVYRDQKKMGDIKRARSLVELLWWMTHEGQIYADSLGFPPLSTEAMREGTKLLRGIHFDDILLH
jgi:phosphate transport system substrate-binding protein